MADFMKAVEVLLGWLVFAVKKQNIRTCERLVLLKSANGKSG